MAKQLAALGCLPRGRIGVRFELLGNVPPEDERAIVAYFEATYIGRPVPNGRRMPPFGHAWRSIERRTRTVSPRKNNASGARNNTFAFTVAHPPPYREVHGGAWRPRRYGIRGDDTVSANRPVADREWGVWENGFRKEDNPRQGVGRKAFADIGATHRRRRRRQTVDRSCS